MTSSTRSCPKVIRSSATPSSTASLTASSGSAPSAYIVGDAQPILGFGRGHAFDTNQYVDTCRRLVLERGEILTSTRTLGLLRDGAGVTGARLELPDGSIREVRAGATVIATGGFQADPELRAAHVHPNAAAIPLRSNPNSRGDGLRLAREVGAATGADNAGFYGHLVPSGIPFADSGDFVGLSLYYSEHALLFNLDNERFVDESVGDHLTTMALLEQPEARGLLIADARVHRDWIVAAYVEGAESSDKFAVASRRGGRCGVAESLEELALLPEEWGYDGQAIADAVAAYNVTVRSDSDPSPGRKLDRLPLDEPPYYVIETVPAITFPFYGIRIDSSARVLDETGEPIPGLLAAGSDTGGLYVRAYAGGIASALVFGLTAARTAMRHPVALLTSPPSRATHQKENHVNLTQRTAIVTGGARGIGAAVSRRLAADGYQVAVLDLDESACAATVAAVEELGSKAIAVGADVADEAAVQSAVDRVASDLGAPTVLVNNAGITRDNLLFKMSTVDWDSVINVHLRGAFLMSRATQQHMTEAGWGRIVNLSSISALGNRGQANYAAAKAGLQGFTKTLAIELGRFGVTVNAIAPGLHRHRDDRRHRRAARHAVRGVQGCQRQADPCRSGR